MKRLEWELQLRCWYPRNDGITLHCGSCRTERFRARPIVNVPVPVKVNYTWVYFKVLLFLLQASEGNCMESLEACVRRRKLWICLFKRNIFPNKFNTSKQPSKKTVQTLSLPVAGAILWTYGPRRRSEPVWWKTSRTESERESTKNHGGAIKRPIKRLHGGVWVTNSVPSWESDIRAGET